MQKSKIILLGFTMALSLTILGLGGALVMTPQKAEAPIEKTEVKATPVKQDESKEKVKSFIAGSKLLQARYADLVGKSSGDATDELKNEINDLRNAISNMDVNPSTNQNDNALCLTVMKNLAGATATLEAMVNEQSMDLQGMAEQYKLSDEALKTLESTVK